MPRALQTSGMGVPLASSESASRSLRMICSGEWRMRFIESPPALRGENDSHIGWTSLRGAGHRLAAELRPHLDPQGGDDGVPGAVGLEAAEEVVAGLPVRQVVGQCPPRAALA